MYSDKCIDVPMGQKSNGMSQGNSSARKGTTVHTCGSNSSGLGWPCCDVSMYTTTSSNVNGYNIMVVLT